MPGKLLFFDPGAKINSQKYFAKTTRETVLEVVSEAVSLVVFATFGENVSWQQRRCGAENSVLKSKI